MKLYWKEKQKKFGNGGNIMKLLTWLFDRADRYAAQSTWRDFALVKLCLCSMGVLLGLLVPARRKKSWWTWLAWPRRPCRTPA